MLPKDQDGSPSAPMVHEELPPEVLADFLAGPLSSGPESESESESLMARFLSLGIIENWFD